MGFTTWSFGPNLKDVDDTYKFIQDHSDIYAEHIDNKIPWKAWINDEPLPDEFSNEIIGRVNRKISNAKLLLSVSLFNSNRDELAEDFDGTVPNYENLNDLHIQNAYYKHINYLVSNFKPDYLVIVIEANEFRLHSENKWDDYKDLIANVKSRIKVNYPNLKISESISLHRLYNSEIENAQVYISDILDYMNAMDFAAISYYPFLKNQHSKVAFQNSLDFLHNNITIPIAFSETSHIAEDLIIPNLDVSITGNELEQKVYLETLLQNASTKNYEFVIWWAHRDFDALWQTFPEDVKDLGRIWRDTGLLDETGQERLAWSAWNTIYSD